MILIFKVVVQVNKFVAYPLIMFTESAKDRFTLYLSY